MINERLRLLREERGLLQRDIAQLLNISTSAYGYYEQGKRTPDMHVIQVLAKFYNVSSDWLIGLSDVRKPKSEIINDKTLKTIESFDPDIISQLCNLKDLSSEEKENLMIFLEGLKARKQQKNEDKKESL